jgi:NADPH:quinone reductase-like Zn-dependent oxidoreductase
LEKGEKLLVRGGTSSVGLAATALAKHHGAFVVSTTRSEARVELLKSCGADDVLIDDGSLAGEARKKYPSGFDKVLELVGATTLSDSLKAVRKGGVVCAAGIAGGKWVIENFNPSSTIPSGVYLTTYSSSFAALMETPIENVARLLKDGKIKIPIKTYKLEQIVEAHTAMDESSAVAKMVVLTG